jgi:hypothetical protein
MLNARSETECTRDGVSGVDAKPCSLLPPMRLERVCNLPTVEHNSCCVYGEEGIANLIWRSVGHMTSLGILPTPTTT